MLTVYTQCVSAVQRKGADWSKVFSKGTISTDFCSDKLVYEMPLQRAQECRGSEHVSLASYNVRGRHFSS